MTQASHQTKFRWTENLTCRFIQLRKENGKLFTGRKYSAQAGWEYILQQMREEFPTIMADVQYRVLKKKWSNLLQQYKELKNPVHGDRNKADDVSWPFYSAIDEVVGHGTGTPNNDEYIDPHEFLCVSVTPEEATSSLPAGSNAEVDRRRNAAQTDRFGGDCPSIQIERVPRPQDVARRAAKSNARKKRESRSSFISPFLPNAELSIEKVTGDAKDLTRARGCTFVDPGRKKVRRTATRNDDEETPRKSRRTEASCHEDHDARIDRRIEEIFEYTKRRDDENRSIMLRIMHAVESIANKLFNDQK